MAPLNESLFDDEVERVMDEYGDDKISLSEGISRLMALGFWRSEAHDLLAETLL